MSNEIKRKPARPVRHQFPRLDSAFLLYNGSPEEYEDAADYVRIGALKGRVLA